MMSINMCSPTLNTEPAGFGIQVLGKKPKTITGFAHRIVKVHPLSGDMEE